MVSQVIERRTVGWIEQGGSSTHDVQQFVQILADNGCADLPWQTVITLLHKRDPIITRHYKEVASVPSTLAVVYWMMTNLSPKVGLRKALTSRLENGVDPSHYQQYRLETLVKNYSGIDGTEKLDIVNHVFKHHRDQAEDILQRILTQAIEIRASSGDEFKQKLIALRRETAVPLHLLNCLLLAPMFDKTRKAVKWASVDSLITALEFMEGGLMDGNPVMDAGRFYRYADYGTAPDEVVFDSTFSDVADRGASLVVKKYINVSNLQPQLAEQTPEAVAKLNRQVAYMQPATSTYLRTWR